MVEIVPMADLIIVKSIQESDDARRRRPTLPALVTATGETLYYVRLAIARLTKAGTIPPRPNRKQERFVTLKAKMDRDAVIRRDLVRQRADEVRRHGFTRPSIGVVRKVDPLADMLRRAGAQQRKSE